MSFEILLTRTVVPGVERRLEPSGVPLTRGDFELIMDGAPVRRKLEDGTRWLWHPQEMAWLAASFREGKEAGDGYIAFAVSYGHNQFLKVWADAIELALRMARHLGARVFEDATYQEITRDNAEQILDPQGKFVTEQDEFWKKSVTSMEERLLAPIEYPVGRYDALNDYFVLFLDPPTVPSNAQALNALNAGSAENAGSAGIAGDAEGVSISSYNSLAAAPLATDFGAGAAGDAKPGDTAVRKIDMPALARKLQLNVAPDSLSPDRFALQDPVSGSILALALLRPNDGAIQIRPFYWMEPFSRVASETLNLAKVLRGELGGRLLLRDKPISPQFETAIEANIKGLGIEFYFWLQSLTSAAPSKQEES